MLIGSGYINRTFYNKGGEILKKDKVEKTPLQLSDIGGIFFYMTIVIWILMILLTVIKATPMGIGWIIQPMLIVLETPTKWWVALSPLGCAVFFFTLEWVICRWKHPKIKRRRKTR